MIASHLRTPHLGWRESKSRSQIGGRNRWHAARHPDSVRVASTSLERSHLLGHRTFAK